ncbi:MAG TPA: polysaccharide biosynthesis tyrosine autokinase [Longimicrobiaceae bacterium]
MEDARFAQPTVAADRVGAGEIWKVVRRGRWLILACFALSLVVGAAFARRLQPMYEASARILVDGRRSAIGMDGLAGPDPVQDEKRIGTEIEVLQSSGLAAAVVDSLQLQLEVTDPSDAVRRDLFSGVRVSPEARPARYRFVRVSGGRFLVTDARNEAALGTFAPGERISLHRTEVVLAPTAALQPAFEVAVDTRDGATGKLASTLRVAPASRDADVILVSYRGTDPELVRDVPNVLAARFVALRRDLRTSEARKTAEFLRQQLDTLRLQLSSAEGRLQSFREREQVVDLPVEASAQVTRQAQMETERSALDAERAALGSLLAQARASAREPGAPSPYRRLVAFPTLLRNDATTGILASLAKVEDERAAILTRRKPNDPEVQVLTRRIEELEGQLAGMVTTYQQGLTGQVAAIDGTLGRFERRMDRIPAKELEMARLTRQTTVLDGMYKLLQTRLKEAEIAQAVQDPSVRMMDAARLPSSPVNPRGKLLVGFSGLFGLLVGVALSFVREYRDGSVRSREDLEAATGFPVLGWIPRMGEGEGRTLRAGLRRMLAAPRFRGRALLPGASGTVSLQLLGTGEAAPTPASDAYEWLHRNLSFARPDAETRAMIFTSPLPGDGKTTSAAGMAVTLARRGLKVLLVDADLRRGALSAALGSPREAGLSDVLAGSVPFGQAVRTLDVGGGNTLHYLPSGALPSDPTRLLGSTRGAALFEWLKEKYFLVVLDCPPLNVFPDAAILGEHAEAVVLVARAGVTPFEALVYAAEQCRRAKLPVVGTVLNDIDPERDQEYDAAYRWYEYARSYYPQAALR